MEMEKGRWERRTILFRRDPGDASSTADFLLLGGVLTLASETSSLLAMARWANTSASG
jgi:hypothetical protein